MEGSVVTGGNLGGARGSGTSGGGVGPSGSPPRDSARGKGVAAAEEETTKVPVEY